MCHDGYQNVFLFQIKKRCMATCEKFSLWENYTERYVAVPGTFRWLNLRVFPSVLILSDLCELFVTIDHVFLLDIFFSFVIMYIPLLFLWLLPVCLFFVFLSPKCSLRICSLFLAISFIILFFSGLPYLWQAFRMWNKGLWPSLFIALCHRTFL